MYGTPAAFSAWKTREITESIGESDAIELEDQTPLAILLGKFGVLSS